jgi:amino acid adenylation domain-containing protein
MIMIKSDQKVGFKKIDFNPFEEEREIDKIIFTNEPQKEVWLSCVLGEDESNLAYNESVSLELNGDFNVQFFLEAIHDVVRRHEALRATISANGEMLVIYKDISFNVPVEDFTKDADQKTILNGFISAEMHKPFDLEHGPLFRFFLHRLAEKKHYFTLVLHHIIVDGWSTGVILHDLSKLYNAKLRGIPALLEEAPQISSYIEEERDFEKSAAYEETRNYWLNMYKNNVPVLDLPTDFPRPALRTYRSKRIDHPFSLELVEQIKAMGAKAGSSLVNTLMNAFEVFLYLQTNHPDLVVGLPTAGQAATEKFNLVGHCVNLLPMRSLIDPSLSFNAYLKKRKVSFFDAYDNQKFTYGQLIKSLNIKRDPSRIPLVPVIFNVDMGMDSTVVFDQLSYRMVSNPRVSETFEISLNATGSVSSFVLEWAYNTQLFKAETIEKMAADFELLLHSLIKDSSVTIRELSNKNSEAWREQLIQWNKTGVEHQKYTRFTKLIDQKSLQFPNKIAVTFKNETLTYTALSERSSQMAAYLVTKGIKVGDIIGVAAERSVEMLVSLLGILKAGGVYLPLDPDFPRERIEYMLSDSNARILLVSKAYHSKFQSNAAEILIDNIWAKLGNYKLNDPEVAINGNDLAYVIYTSGSTGKPKGVQVMHYNLINFLTSMKDKPGIRAEDRLLAITTISFDIAGLELFLPLIAGAELIICDTQIARDGRMLIELLEEKKITFMQATPSTWRMMLDAGWQGSPSLKALCGGEALPKELSDSLVDKTMELWNMYGPTETTIWSTIKHISNKSDPITIGKPIQNTRIYILNEVQELVAPGTTGEIFIGGNGVAAGYLNQPALSAERFIKDPFSVIPGTRLYKTGDLGKFTENGEILYLGRIDQQVKIRGHRIELGEIETLIAGLKNIKQTVVLAREDKPGDIRLVAYVVLTNNEPYIDTSVTNHWKKLMKLQLPDYMIPGDFVVLQEFPLTPNHKIDKKALPKPQSRVMIPGLVDDLPLDRSERIISDIWSSILDLENIGTKDDFFELGGHSLLAAKVMTAIEKETGKRLPLATLFENSTIEKLAKKIHSEDDEEWEALVPIKTTGSKDPVYLIHGAGLNVLLFKAISKYMDPEQPVYGLQAIGLNRPSQLFFTVEEIAAVYISEIMKVNPEGPYCLAGYSMGGFIAYEMAKQLTEMGKTIKFLGMLDTYAGNTAATEDTPNKLSKKFRRQFSKIPFFTKSFLNNPKEAIDYQLQVIRTKLGRFSSNVAEPGIEHFTPYEKEIYDSYDFAHEHYTLVPAEIKISLFNVRKRLYYLDDLVYLGWDKLAKKGVEIHGVPGDHKTFLYPPNDIEFAHILQAALDNI